MLQPYVTAVIVGTPVALDPLGYGHIVLKLYRTKCSTIVLEYKHSSIAVGGSYLQMYLVYVGMAIRCTITKDETSYTPSS
jgi:hypothetical protein